ncbi:hypothetical protein BKA69DRAFT_1129202 [Paraphysoderma sedebokerense]|nr:hypothetical protein BKA69DRAFT_1129202 [Paraphysoderma sedebokerense]
MTHLSDFSYLERGIVDVFILIWMLMRIRNSQNYSSLHPKYLLEFLTGPRRSSPPLKLIITYTLVFSLTVMIIYDFLATKMKYEEGFSHIANSTNCATKPSATYNTENKFLVDVTNTLLNVAWCSKSTASFLLIAFWSHTGSQYGLKKPFVTSLESKLCSAWAVFSVFLYPLLQYSFVSNKLLSTVTPQFVYHAETCMVAVLSCVVQYRLRHTIERNASAEDLGSQGSRTRFAGQEILRYHLQCNLWMILWNFMDFIADCSINIDAISLKILASNKFLLDLFTKFFSLGFSAAYVVMIQILFPLHEQVNSTVTSTSQKKPSTQNIS